MSRKPKEANMNLYYMNDGQGSKKREDIEDIMKRKKAKEREKRIKQRKQMIEQDDFDSETESVINMTNKNRLKKEEVNRKKQTKKEEKRNKRNKRIKLVLKIIVLIGLIAGGIAFAVTSPIFNIKNIRVMGNNIVSEDTIVSLSELKQDENIFKFNKLSTIKKIKENAYIESVIINRKLFNTIQIKVEERNHTYSIDFMGRYAYINNQGYILEISEVSEGVPIIRGITTEEEFITPGNRLNNEDLEKMEDIIKIINVAKDNNLDGKVTSIDIENENEYSIYISEEKKEIHLGDASKLGDKMLNAISIIGKTKGIQGEIFVNGDLNNKFKPYFREKIEL